MSDSPVIAGEQQGKELFKRGGGGVVLNATFKKFLFARISSLTLNIKNVYERPNYYFSLHF